MRFCGGNFEQQRFTHLLLGHLVSELLHSTSSSIMSSSSSSRSSSLGRSSPPARPSGERAAARPRRLCAQGPVPSSAAQAPPLVDKWHVTQLLKHDNDCLTKLLPQLLLHALPLLASHLQLFKALGHALDTVDVDLLLPHLFLQPQHRRLSVGKSRVEDVNVSPGNIELKSM